MGLSLLLCLTGCYGDFKEDYEAEGDFSPPAVALSIPNTEIEESLLSAINVDWEDSRYNQKTKDIFSAVKNRNKVELHSAQVVDLILNNSNLNIKQTSGSLWKNDSKLPVEFIADLTFVLPSEQGDYLLVLDIETDKGTAQYVGNIVISE
jgi:PBP1b-binding outer membrane lipoprotein LpoB